MIGEMTDRSALSYRWLYVRILDLFRMDQLEPRRRFRFFYGSVPYGVGWRIFSSCVYYDGLTFECT